jgi:hypothetical protein
MRWSCSSVLGLLAGCCLLGACQTGPLMTPGEDCNGCHRKGGNARAFTVSGTVFSHADVYAPSNAVDSTGVAGVEVRVTDADGKQLSLQTNAAGNFYTAEPVRLPLITEIQRGAAIRHMSSSVTSGGCSSCHTEPPSGGAPGRVFIGANEPPSNTVVP